MVKPHVSKPCGWFEDEKLCGQPSTSQMGDWPLCQEHGDQIIREALELLYDEQRESMLLRMGL